MDSKDEQIINVLKENCKLSTQQISRKTLIPITTVHNRIKKMEKDGIIEKYTVILNNKKFGRPISAYILISVDYKLLKEIKKTQYEIAKKLKSKDFVEEVSMVTGDRDIMIKLRVKDMDELNEFVTKYLRNIDGIGKTHSMVILHEL
jgi:DNA-binding Lrp family transcriptional regulator